MNLEEASMNFDLENVQPFLERLEPLIESGFSRKEILQVQSWLENFEIDEEKELSFAIRYKGSDTVLKIEAFMDDIDAPDIAFFTHPDLAEEINEQLVTFADELGL